MNLLDDDINQMQKIRERKKEKVDLKTVLNRKNFDSFELDSLMNEAE
ncbi:hypothetical protein KY345_01755 [Candidatus Woesearchaeota archaeon]|nr:hypothetical protein [Candidatus Woesearchaeota archaeon]